MSFNGSEGTSIESATAGNWTRAYRTENPDSPKGYFMGKTILQQILNQTGCMGIRVYYGLDGTTPKLVFVGADANQNDMITGKIVADNGCAAPPYSSANNALNS